MSLTTSAARPKVKHSAESILFGFNFGPLLNSGETISSVSSMTVSGLTIGTPAANVAKFLDDDGATVEIGEGVRVRISGGTSGTDYTLTCTVTTSASNTRTIVGTLQVRDT